MNKPTPKVEYKMELQMESIEASIIEDIRQHQEAESEMMIFLVPDVDLKKDKNDKGIDGTSEECI